MGLHRRSGVEAAKGEKAGVQGRNVDILAESDSFTGGSVDEKVVKGRAYEGRVSAGIDEEMVLGAGTGGEADADECRFTEGNDLHRKCGAAVDKG